jgi:hypothetical protein
MAKAEQKKQPAGVQKKYYRFHRTQHENKTSYKSKMVGLEEDAFNLGSTSDATKFSKSIKSIKNYIQKTFTTPDGYAAA